MVELLLEYDRRRQAMREMRMRRSSIQDKEESDFPST
jgi:hypothetical protein